MNSSSPEVFSEIVQKIGKLESQEDREAFLRAFLTPKEVKTLGDRYKIIEMLLQGVPQREIAQKLKVSVSQISRGSQELQFGVGADIFPKIFKK